MNNNMIGSIIFVKDIIFSNSKTNKKHLDHAHELGRPCLLIFSDEEYDYFLTLTSTKRNNYRYTEYYELTSKDYDYIYRKSNSPIGYINVRNIYKKRICGYGMDEIGKIKFDVYKKIIKKLKDYHKNNNLDTIKENANIIGGR